MRLIGYRYRWVNFFFAILMKCCSVHGFFVSIFRVLRHESCTEANRRMTKVHVVVVAVAILFCVRVVKSETTVNWLKANLL